MGVRVRVCPGVGPEGWLRWFAHPFVMLCAGGMHSTLFLLPTPCFFSWLFRSGIWAFLVFLYFLSIICPNWACTQLFLVPYSFFVFFGLRKCLSRCKHCSTAAKGPRSQPVSFPSERLYTLILKGWGAKGLFFWNFFLLARVCRP